MAASETATCDERIRQARENPEDAVSQVRAAYACDPEGREQEAVLFYDAAAGLGVPDEFEPEFSLGHGSTLRNVGRLEDSERVLRGLIGRYPAYQAAYAFLALTLQEAGRSSEAVAELIALLLRPSGDDRSLARYSRALNFYAGLLKQSGSTKE
jgi:hypothetical protein